MKAKKDKKQKNKGVIKYLMGSIREYKKPSLLAPLFVMGEVVLECLIPWIMTLLLGRIKEVSNAGGDLVAEILKYGAILLGIAFASLACGALSGRFCAVASTAALRGRRKLRP